MCRMKLLIKNLKDCGYESEFLNIVENTPNYNLDNYIEKLIGMNSKCINDVIIPKNAILTWSIVKKGGTK